MPMASQYNAMPSKGYAGPLYVTYEEEPHIEDAHWRQAVVKWMGEVDLSKKQYNWLDMMQDIGGGTGASLTASGDTLLSQALLRRMKYQDKVVMLLLLLAYTGSLMFSASLAYRQASNNYPVTYYADPRSQTSTTESHDMEGFAYAFNQPPKDVQLQVMGLVPLPPLPDFVMDVGFEWLGARYRIEFSFALDLSPWLVRDGEAPTRDPRNPAVNEEEAMVGITPEERQKLRDWLRDNKNDLAYIDMTKEVCWPGWEDLATNVKSKIRQAGFTGVIRVRHTTQESFGVHKNRPWANFMHSRTTKVLCALSVFGWFFYQPYMWLRHSSTRVCTKYRVQIPVNQFWRLISNKIGPYGFNSMADDDFLGY